MKQKFSRIRSTVLLISSAFAISTSAQSNLVPYGDFESYSALAIELNATLNPCYNGEFPTGWVSPTSGTPDMISDGTIPCDYGHNNAGCGFYPQVCEFDNKMGCQMMMPATAPYQSVSHVYMGIYTAGTAPNFPNDPFREYIRTNLNVSGGLSAGQCYRLTYYVSRADMTKFATPVQALITNQDLTNTNSFAGVLNPGGANWFRPSIVIDKQGWTRFDYDFIAQGGETYLYLGFFEDQNGPIVYDDNAPMDCEETAGFDDVYYANNTPTAAYYYIDNISMFATAGPTFAPDFTFTNTNPNISGTFSNQEILISGDVTISANTIFDGCTVKCNDGSTITVPYNKTLQILNNTVIEAGCANMWDGIIVEGGSITMRGSRISDAKTAITFNSGTCYWQIHRDTYNRLNYFSRNTVDIVVNSSWGSGSYIEATLFDHLTPLHDVNEGIGGYGTYNIVFTGLNSSNTETIGSTTASEGCVFTGGQSAIVSDKYNVNLVNCTFSNQAKAAVDFEGEASTIRTLNVTSCTFMYAQKHIWAHDRVDLAVKSSTLSYASENSIEWMNNHDCYLQIGDEISSSLGNTFSSNGWYAVVAMHNTSAQTANDLLALNIQYTMGPPAHYTSMVIANNTVNCIPSSSGILIAEWQLGQDVSYHELNILDNTFNNTFNGIQLYNVNGWGGEVFTDPFITAPLTQLQFNMINTSSSFAANSAGIKVMNSHGFALRENGVASDNSFNYVNNGIYLQNAENTEVYGNIISAGTCISANFDVYGSNMHCNWLSAYSTGFYLGYAWLRGGSAYTHGEPAYEEYNNLVPYTMYPWNADIFVDNSDVANNQWIWNGAATNLGIVYNGNTGSGSLISSYTGADRCDNGFPGYAPFDGNYDMTFSSDPVMQWIADYQYEVRMRNTGIGSDAIASANIKDLIDIEELMATGEYEDALTALGSFTPDNDVEENYKAVLTIFATLGDEGGRVTSDTEKGNLIAIAELPTHTGGPAVTLARGYLEATYYLHYDDPRAMEDGEIHGTANLSSPCSLEPASDTWLSFIDEDGNDLGVEGCHISADGSFIFDPLEVAYLTTQNPSTEYRIFSKPGSKYTVVTFEYNTLSEWLTASPFNLNLAGVSVDIDTTTGEQFVDLQHYEESEINGFIYSIGSVESANGTDFLIEKRDGNGLVWTRTWHGPVEQSEDAATCLYVDAEENVYVAGKVYNGDDYDCQMLKYDSNGNLIWTSLFIDAERTDDVPDGIYFDDSDQSVQVEGMCGSAYRYIKVWQCLPSGARLAQTPQDELMQTVAPATFYPSPSNGKLNVALTGENGGLFELMNLEGQVVYTRQITQTSEIELPTSIVDGVYLIKFTGEGEPYYQKLMIYRN